MPSNRERRRHTRVKPKQLATRVRAGQRIHVGLPVDDISLGGVFVKCSAPFPLRTNVALELTRPGLDRPVALWGQVVSTLAGPVAVDRGHSPGMGIAFTLPIPPDVAPRLEGLIASIDPAAVRVAVAVATADAVIDAHGAPLMAVKTLSAKIDRLEEELAHRAEEVEHLRAENEQLKQRLTLLGHWR